jgi:hypothetical protein
MKPPQCQTTIVAVPCTRRPELEQSSGLGEPVRGDGASWSRAGAVGELPFASLGVVVSPRAP